jgi:hypothetical protein
MISREGEKGRNYTEQLEQTPDSDSMREVVFFIGVSDDIVPDSRHKYFIDNVFKEIDCVFVGLFEHYSRVKVFHV